MNSTIVSSKWLSDNFDNPDLIVLDASQPSGKSKSNMLQIIGARPFDIKGTFSDKSSSFPNTFPSKEQFEEGCQELGINSSSKIVVYDSLGIYTSPRAWLMFKAMGHENIAVLDGGFPEWIANGFETTETIVEKKYSTGNFKATFQPEMIRSIDFVKENLSKKESLVIDARSADRFNSLVPEPRADLRSGNIPNSINIPFQNTIENGKFKSVKKLRRLFKENNSENKSLVFSCGSGITACIVLLATELVFEGNKAIYDGSWTEWAQLEN
jgi:thiosulfate/3-mercaptopyruvate sulfurtransferase